MVGSGRDLARVMVVQVVAAGSLWGSGLPRVWGFVRNARAGWLGNRSVDGVTAGCDCGVVGFGWSEPLLVFPMPSPGMFGILRYRWTTRVRPESRSMRS